MKERADDGSSRLVAPRRPMSVKDVLMHMSGLGMGAMAASADTPNVSMLDGTDTLADVMTKLADQPLVFHPGTSWLYGISTDVCGRLVEILSGQRFDEYLQSAIFGPLGMTDTGFTVGDDQVDRFAASYFRRPDKSLKLVDDPETSPYRKERAFLSGGGGLVSTTADYLRFTQMLVNGGELDGVRILGRKTVELMASNHLPGGGTMTDFAMPGGFGEVGFTGMGFGLTVAVNEGPEKSGVISSKGDFTWGGYASTIFWVDPAEELVVIFMTQLIPSGTFNFRDQLKALVYPSIVD